MGAPQWSTRVSPLANGREKRNKEWQYPLQKYTANIAAFTEAARNEMLGLFYVCAGQWGAFRFSDRVDYLANGETITVTAGTKTPAQLVKTYTFGSTSFSRPI